MSDYNFIYYLGNRIFVASFSIAKTVSLSIVDSMKYLAVLTYAPQRRKQLCYFFFNLFSSVFRSSKK